MYFWLMLLGFTFGPAEVGKVSTTIVQELDFPGIFVFGGQDHHSFRVMASEQSIWASLDIEFLLT